MGIRPIKGKIIVTIINMNLAAAVIEGCIAVVIERGSICTPAYVVSACYASTIFSQRFFIFCTGPKDQTKNK
jgi:hypothetical protein